jgi:hypothetical protein
MPSVGEPFGKILVDCVGPLPRTASGNLFLLTIMCTATRFLEAIPLKNITAKSVIKALLKFFSWVGLPKHKFHVQCFQPGHGSVRGQTSCFISLPPRVTGHASLKSMLKAYCFENTKSWDEGVLLVLFAACECVQESLGFSPFELVFAHEVRGPLRLLKEKWLCEGDENVNILDFVAKFRHRLSQACEMAESHLLKLG